MATVGELLVVIAGNSMPLTAALTKSEAELKGFSSSGVGSLRAVGMAGAALAAGAALFGVEAVKSASHFQAAMELIRTQAGGTQAEVDSMSKAVLGLAPTVGVGPEALAAGLYHLESAGFRGAAAMNILRAAAEGAKVGHANLEEVTNALNASVVSGIPGVQNATQAMGALNAIVGAGDMRMQNLTEALGTGVLAVVKGFGLSLNDAGAALATFGDNNIRGADAATQLRMSVLFLAQGTSHTDTVLRGIGLTSKQLRTDMQSGGLIGALSDLHAHLVKAGDTGTKMGPILLEAFGHKAGVGLSVLEGQFTRFVSKFEEIRKGASSFGDAWAGTQATVAQQAASISASFDTITTAIGAGLLPAVSQILSAVTPIVTGVAQWAAANEGLAARILAVAAGIGALLASVLVLGPVLGAIGTVIGVITSPILLVGAAIGALAAHFGLLGDGAQKMVDGFGATIAGVIPQVLATLQQLGGQVVSWIAAQAPIWAAQVLSWGRAFVGWAAPLVGQAMAMLGAFAGQVGRWIAAQAPVWASQVLGWGQAFVAWVTPMIGQAVAMLGDLAGQIGGWIAAQAPAWATQLVAWGDAFIEWISPMIGQALEGLGALAGQIASWIVAQIPDWLAQLGRWAGAFIGWVGPMIPGALAALGQFAGRIVDWIAAQLPTWLAALLRWVDAFVAWVAPMIPKVIAALAVLGLQIIGWIVGRIPAIAAALVGLAATFVAWVAPKIPGLLVELGKLALGMIGWIAQQIPVIAIAVGKWIVSFIGWIAQAIPQAVIEFGKWLAGVLAWMATVPGTLFAAAVKWGKSIVDGIMSGIGDIAKTVGDKLNTIPGVSLVGNIPGGIGDALNNITKLPGGVGDAISGHHAMGGMLNSGWNLVGEQGPELIHDGQVYTAGQTALGGGHRASRAENDDASVTPRRPSPRARDQRRGPDPRLGMGCDVGGARRRGRAGVGHRPGPGQHRRPVVWPGARPAPVHQCPRSIGTFGFPHGELYTGEITRSRLDLPPGRPWRRWKLSASDLNTVMDLRLVGAPDGYSWTTIDGGRTHTPYRPFAHAIHSDRTTVQTCSPTTPTSRRRSRAGGGLFQISFFVFNWIPLRVMYDRATGVEPPALDERHPPLGAQRDGGARRFPIFCWIDPSGYVHWEAFHDPFTAPGGLTTMGPHRHLRAAPAVVTDVGVDGTTRVGGRGLFMEYDATYMPEQAYVGGVTDFIYRAARPASRGPAGGGAGRRTPTKRQILVDAQAITEAQRDAVACTTRSSALAPGSRARSRSALRPSPSTGGAAVSTSRSKTPACPMRSTTRRGRSCRSRAR
jgi:TP901 family phage tail tape measure protein